jgi:hypothetical protein
VGGNLLSIGSTEWTKDGDIWVSNNTTPIEDGIMKNFLRSNKMIIEKTELKPELWEEILQKGEEFFDE